MFWHARKLTNSPGGRLGSKYSDFTNCCSHRRKRRAYTRWFAFFSNWEGIINQYKDMKYCNSWKFWRLSLDSNRQPQTYLGMLSIWIPTVHVTLRPDFCSRNTNQKKKRKYKTSFQNLFWVSGINWIHISFTSNIHNTFEITICNSNNGFQLWKSNKC